MLKFGYITELDVDNGLVRVNFTDDGIVSNPLPVSMPATKTDKYSFPFVINEPVWCLMDENCEFGVVGGAIYNQKTKPSGDASADTVSIDINSGKLNIKVDRQTGKLTINGKADVVLNVIGNVEITAPTTQITGNVIIQGQLSAAGYGGLNGAPITATSGLETTQDVKAGTISLKNHIHTSGGAGTPTTPPNP